MSTSRKRRWTARRSKAQPDALLSRDGSRIPVWSAEATDPVEHLAAVLDQLKDSRRVAGNR